MYTDILRTISGIAVYPIVSLALFVAFFSGVIAWAVRADGARLDRLAAMPLDDDRGSATPSGGRETARRML